MPSLRITSDFQAAKPFSLNTLVLTPAQMIWRVVVGEVGTAERRWDEAGRLQQQCALLPVGHHTPAIQCVHYTQDACTKLLSCALGGNILLSRRKL